MSRNLWIFIQLVFAYEWLVSGINKVISPHYLQAFHKALQSSQIDYGFYADFVKNVALPHSNLFALLVAAGELAVGLALVVLSILMMRRVNGRFARTLGVAANGIGALMTLNFFFYQNGHYFISSGDPFDEGLPIDFVMAIIQVGLAVGYGRMQRVWRGRHTRTSGNAVERVGEDASDSNHASDAAHLHVLRHKRSEVVRNSR